MARIEYPFRVSVESREVDGAKREFLSVSEGVFLGVDGNPLKHVTLGGEEFDITEISSGAVAIRVPFAVFFPWGDNVLLPEYEGSYNGEPVMPSQSEMNSFFANVRVAGHRAGTELPRLVCGKIGEMVNTDGVLYFPVAKFSRSGNAVSVVQILKSDFCFPLQRSAVGASGWEGGNYIGKNFCAGDFEDNAAHAFRVSAGIKDGTLAVSVAPGCVFFEGANPTMRQLPAKELSASAGAGTYYVAIGADTIRESWDLTGIYFQDSNINKWCCTLTAANADVYLMKSTDSAIGGSNALRPYDESNGTGSPTYGRQYFSIAQIAVASNDDGSLSASVSQLRFNDLFLPTILSTL